jgi:hypothetical protein
MGSRRASFKNRQNRPLFRSSRLKAWKLSSMALFGLFLADLFKREELNLNGFVWVCSRKDRNGSTEFRADWQAAASLENSRREPGIFVPLFSVTGITFLQTSRFVRHSGFVRKLYS